MIKNVRSIPSGFCNASSRCLVRSFVFKIKSTMRGTEDNSAMRSSRRPSLEMAFFMASISFSLRGMAMLPDNACSKSRPVRAAAKSGYNESSSILENRLPVATCTWASEATPIGFGSNSSKYSSNFTWRSCSTICFRSSSDDSGHSDWRGTIVLVHSRGNRYDIAETCWPNLM
ncbi:hypothetical protein OGAPHI_006029 [Ogataea philodendri]|uniref:Uncharacterized protein n=1 Tax=Ogataea philodendri TaxID=1378263 RepID=A0A9P8T1E1_9ASCO|nr:uncharacterized protein OGAPHI_006029 [Ogataea philodendri]KAH3661850.1 hypothetical protein OGAPHI_006029 [Ogataea philodendri]